MRRRIKRRLLYYMEFDYVVGWYSRTAEKVKPLGGFSDIEAAKEFSDIVDALFLGEGFLYIEAPEGKYINGYEKYSDYKSKWFTPEEVNTKNVLVYSAGRCGNMRLDEFLPYDDYKKFTERRKSSVMSKLIQNKSAIDSAGKKPQQEKTERQIERM